MIVVHPTLVEVHGDLLTTRAFRLIDKIKAPQSSTATLAVQPSYCPLGLWRERISGRIKTSHSPRSSHGWVGTWKKSTEKPISDLKRVRAL